MRARDALLASTALGLGAVAWGAVVEVRAFALRQFTVPVLLHPEVKVNLASKNKITKVIQINAHGVVEHVMETAVLAADQRLALSQLLQKLRPVVGFTSRKTRSEAQQSMGIASSCQPFPGEEFCEPLHDCVMAFVNCPV